MGLTAEQKAVLLRQHLDDGVPLTRLATAAGVPQRTLQRWKARYRVNPTVAGLARQTRADRGRRRLPAELIETIEALALHRPEPAVAFVHRRVVAMAATRGWAPPSYSSVRAVIAGIDPGLRALALDGEAAYRDRFELVYRREATAANQQWQADHTADSSGGRKELCELL